MDSEVATAEPEYNELIVLFSTPQNYFLLIPNYPGAVRSLFPIM